MNIAVVGAQWGDEGKGKLIDILSKDVDVTVRYQGGSNAEVILTRRSFQGMPQGIRIIRCHGAGRAFWLRPLLAMSLRVYPFMA